MDDPNILKTRTSDGRNVFFRVTKRFEDMPTPDRIETSEVSEAVFDAEVVNKPFS